MSELAKQIENLMKLPQSLCNTCGKCCRIATFKGGFTYEQIVELSKSTTAEKSQIEGAKDFLKIFTPYENTAKARKCFPEFVDNTLKYFGKNDDEMDFFYCKYIADDNLCKIHEDRPQLCRMYPIPHEKTFYLPGCGFEEQGKKNWAQIKKILDALGINYDGK